MPRWIRLVWLVSSLLWASSVSAANLTFTWLAPTTNVDGSTPVDVTGYWLYWRLPGGTYNTTERLNAGASTTGTITGLTASTLYYVTVTAYDASQNESPLSQETGEFTGPTTPTAPTFLRQAAMVCRQVRLRWNLAVDDLVVTEYRVRRGGVQIGTTAGTVLVYDDSTVQPSTAYTYVVRAADVSNNESGDSNSLVVTTPACP